MIAVPPDNLRPETLQVVIEEFVTRDGAVHGHTDTPLNVMVAGIQRQLKLGKVVVVYDEQTETYTIVPKEQLNGLRDERCSPLPRCGRNIRS
ncbi:MAG: YheU family protein [Planctomycetota bacterium]|nr:YheU family protein [Planctomycetota bacterium]